MPFPNSPFSKLPSIHDLIKHPQVQGVVDRINQTTLAGRAASFLEEMQSYLRRRTEQVPSIHMIAERFARHLLGNGDMSAPVINATGVVLGDELLIPPIADVAIQEIARLAGEYHLAVVQRSSSLPQQNVNGLGKSCGAEQVEQLLFQCTGAESAWVASSTAGARRLIQMSLGDTCEVIWAGHAGVVDSASFGLAGILPIAKRLGQQDQLVLVEGAGMLGASPCGIVLGKRASMDKLREHPAALSLTANSMTLAALRATLNLYRGEQIPIHQVPILQLLSAPLDNLRQRAQRLAQLMQEADPIGEALPLQAESIWRQVGSAASSTDSPWQSSGDIPLTSPTWCISLRPASEASNASEQLLKDLQNGQRPVLARRTADRVLLDLRSVFPRWDQELVAAVEQL